MASLLAITTRIFKSRRKIPSIPVKKLLLMFKKSFYDEEIRVVSYCIETFKNTRLHRIRLFLHF